MEKIAKISILIFWMEKGKIFCFIALIRWKCACWMCKFLIGWSVWWGVRTFLWGLMGTLQNHLPSITYGHTQRNTHSHNATVHPWENKHPSQDFVILANLSAIRLFLRLKFPPRILPYVIPTENPSFFPSKIPTSQPFHGSHSFSVPISQHCTLQS